MSNPANLRIYNFILPEGNVKLKGLGTKEKEFVVSEIEFGEGDFTEKQKQALAIIKLHQARTFAYGCRGRSPIPE